MLEGGAGKDTAVFNYAFAETTIGANSVTSLWLRSAGGVQVDTVSGIEVYKFADGEINVADGNVLVDDFAYLNGYRDVYRSGDPSAHFNTSAYLAVNGDVGAARINPLEHYLDHGVWRGGSSTTRGGSSDARGFHGVTSPDRHWKSPAPAGALEVVRYFPPEAADLFS